jgi:hypothetical protein
MSIKINHAQESLSPTSGVLKVNAAGALALPTGDVSTRPSISAAGYVRFQSTDVVPEYFDGTNWQTITDKVYVDNKITTEINRAMGEESVLAQEISSLSLNSLTDVQVLNPTDSQVITFDSALGIFRNQTQSLNPTTKTFNADGSTLEFDLQTSVNGVNNLVVSINGIQQEPFYSYTLVNGRVVVFDEAPEQGDRIQVRILQSTVSSDRPRPRVVNIVYGALSNYTTITIVATDITYGTTAKIGDKRFTRIDYPASDRMQIMIESNQMNSAFWTQQQDLTLIDTSGNEFVFYGLINYGTNVPYWTDSSDYIGTFSGGESIIFNISVNNATTITIDPVYTGETALSWLSVSNGKIVGTAPRNSSPSRYEVKVTASNGSVYITKNYWLLVI